MFENVRVFIFCWKSSRTDFYSHHVNNVTDGERMMARDVTVTKENV